MTPVSTDHIPPHPGDRRVGEDRGRASPPSWRRWAVVGAVTCAAVGTVVFTLGSRSPTFRAPVGRDTVGCYERLDLDANITVLSGERIARPGGAERACRETWPEAFGGPAPRELALCVVPGGGQAVMPATAFRDAADACDSIGANPMAQP